MCIIGHFRKFPCLKLLISLGGECFGAGRCGALLDPYTTCDVDYELSLTRRQPPALLEGLADLYSKTGPLQDALLLA